MTPAERKAGLRRGADAKYKHQSRLGASKTEQEILWGIIDSLVDECAEPQPVDTGVEYRCLWEENIAGAGWVPCSGKVGSFGDRLHERINRLGDWKARRVMIEARPKTEGSPWPRPWDEETATDANDVIAGLAGDLLEKINQYQSKLSEEAIDLARDLTTFFRQRRVAGK